MTGDFLPPLQNARRMFGGRRVRFHQPLQIGDADRARCPRSRGRTRKPAAAARSPGHGRARAQRGDSGVAITEEQDLVYRAQVARDASARAATGAARATSKTAVDRDKPAWSRTIVPDPVLLFRYSALTFNAHRIHYDLPYTRDVEGYPGSGHERRSHRAASRGDGAFALAGRALPGMTRARCTRCLLVRA